MKIFISQPMGGKTDEEILSQRQSAIETLQKKYPGCEALDTFFVGYEGNAVQHLGKSILVLGEADLAVFLPGWGDARGCRIEEQIARDYGIQKLYLPFI